MPFVLAHRGGAGLELENSPSAIERSRILGVEWIETDVRASADGLCVVIHDATVDRTARATGSVRLLSARELHQLVLRNGDPLLTLAQALRTWPDLSFNVDVKCDDAVIPFLRAVAAADAWHRVCAASFAHKRLARLRRLAGPRLATSQSPFEVAALAFGLPTRANASHPAAVASQVPHKIRGRTVATPRFVARSHARGQAVHVWTVNDAQAMRELLANGVDGLVTDYPDLALQVLAESPNNWPRAL